jgi:hypothetical protein
MKFGDKRNIGKVEQEWNSSISFTPQSNTRKLINALLSEADRIDETLQDVYDEQHIDTASGKSLEQFGKLVNTPRKQGESDTKYRTRVKAEFAQSLTGTNFDAFVEFVTTVINTDINNFDILTRYKQDPASVVISANPEVYQSVELTTTEIADLLDGGVPAGHTVQVREGGTLRVKEDGEFDTAEKGLTSDNIDTGGTLAADVV